MPVLGQLIIYESVETEVSCAPAIVTRVHDDGSADITVFPPLSSPYFTTIAHDDKSCCVSSVPTCDAAELTAYDAKATRA